jgi:hypothetical protein
VSAFWPSAPVVRVSTSPSIPHLAARGEVEEEWGEAAITATVLMVVACLLPFVVLLVQVLQRSRLVFV